MIRTPTDGKPFYCETCGLGWGEYMACEEVDCRLEDALAAGSRRAKTAQPVECEASQSGGKAVTPTPSGSDPQEKVGI